MYNDQLSVQQFRDGVVLKVCCGSLFVRFFNKYYVATIPKSRFEFELIFFIVDNLK